MIQVVKQRQQKNDDIEVYRSLVLKDLHTAYQPYLSSTNFYFAKTTPLPSLKH